MSQVIKDPVKHGRRIREIADLEEATLQKKCVITGRGVMMPAAWVFQMPGQEIGIYIKNGLWIYKGKLCRLRPLLSVLHHRRIRRQRQVCIDATGDPVSVENSICRSGRL